jgi:RNA polymerase sigma factor (sigma-70 family)
MNESLTDTPEVVEFILSRLHNRLKACALSWFEDRSYGGESAEDLVQNTLVWVIEEGVWKKEFPTFDDLYRYVRKAMRHKFVDLLREHGKTVSVETLPELEQPSKVTDTEQDESERALLGKWMQSHFRANDIIRVYIDLWWNKRMTRKQIAEKMRKTPRQITNLRRRLFYKLRPLADTWMIYRDEPEK